MYPLSWDIASRRVVYIIVGINKLKKMLDKNEIVWQIYINSIMYQCQCLSVTLWINTERIHGATGYWTAAIAPIRGILSALNQRFNQSTSYHWQSYYFSLFFTFRIGFRVSINIFQFSFVFSRTIVFTIIFCFVKISERLTYFLSIFRSLLSCVLFPLFYYSFSIKIFLIFTFLIFQNIA